MDETSLQFAQPFWIAAGLLVCAIIVAVFIRFDRRREADLAKLVHPRFRLRLTDGFSPRMRNIKRGLWLAAVLMIFTAIARPQKGYEWNEVKRKGIDILFAVDTSRSMLAEDLAPNRLERARLGIIDFVARLEGDRVGLIPFAGSAFALCPLTLDYSAFQESLNALHTDIIPRQGTNIASAIREAERLFDEQGNNHRVLVLLTDGEDLEGSVIDVAKTAAKKGMSIYTVGVGSPDGATIPIRHPNGRMDFVREADGTMVKTVLDESTLKKIAEETEGLYVPLGRGAEGLDTIYQERLRLVPKSELEQRMERIPLERFEWPLGLAIALLLAEFFMNDRRKPKKPRALPSAARISKTTAVLLLGLFSSGVMKSKAADAAVDSRKIYNKGTEAYLSGDFAAAGESLRASLRTRDLKLQQRSYYNLGNTLYRTGQGTLEKDPEATIKSWEEALKAYDDALTLDAGDADAAFNKELVAKKLEELKNQQKQDEQKDEEKKDDEEKEDEENPEEKDDEKEQEEQDKGEDSKEEQKPEDGEKGDEEKESDEQKGEESEEQDSKDGDEPKPGEDPADGEKESEDPAGAEPGEDKPGEEEQAEAGEERGEKEQMTEEEALQLLESLRGDDRMVIPIPRGDRREDNTTKGKTW